MNRTFHRILALELLGGDLLRGVIHTNKKL